MRFGKTIDVARKRYRSFIMDGIALGRSDKLVGIGTFRGNVAPDNELKDSRVLGKGDFVEQIIRHTEDILPGRKIPLESIIARTLETLEVTETELLSRTRQLRVANARGIICHMAFKSGHSGVAIARRLTITGAGVTVGSRRGRELIKNYPELAAIVD